MRRRSRRQPAAGNRDDDHQKNRRQPAAMHRRYNASAADWVIASHAFRPFSMGEGDRPLFTGPTTLTLPRTRGREGLTVRVRHTDAMAASAHFLPGLDWLIKLGIGLIVAAAGVLLIRPRRRDGWRFAIGIFT